MVTVSVAKWCVRVRQLLRSRYVRLLEDELARARGEVTRLRAENERLREEQAALAAGAADEIAALRAENRAVINSLLGTAGVPPIETPRAFIPTPPVRRRSWPQIATTREIEAARAERIAHGRVRAEVPGKGSIGGKNLQPAPEHERERQSSRAEAVL